MDMRQSFEILRNAYGNHGNAALRVGLTAEHYRAIRNGRVPIPRRTAELIILKAREAEAMTSGLSQERETVSV